MTGSGKFQPNNHSGAKLTAQAVVWGREQYDAHCRTKGREGMNMRQIAEIQGVSRETVARYLRGETWKSVAMLDDVLADDQEAAQERMAQAMAPSQDSAEIQASLARLMGKLEIQSQPKEKDDDQGK